MCRFLNRCPVREELLAQAEAAGYQLELITSSERLPSGTYSGYNASGTNLSLLITTLGVQVELR